jgi:hypothetical protein
VAGQHRLPRSYAPHYNIKFQSNNSRIMFLHSFIHSFTSPPDNQNLAIEPRWHRMDAQVGGPGEGENGNKNGYSETILDWP